MIMDDHVGNPIINYTKLFGDGLYHPCAGYDLSST
jgi:hypothetical protein